MEIEALLANWSAQKFAAKRYKFLARQPRKLDEEERHQETESCETLWPFRYLYAITPIYI